MLKRLASAALFLILIAASGSGCRRVDGNRRRQLKSEQIQMLLYIKDERTGLCFAAYNGISRGGLAHVPCSALGRTKIRKVEKQGDIFE